MSEQIFRILVTGSRKWTDQALIWTVLDAVAKEALAAGCTEVVVVHGCAPGADSLADAWMRSRRRYWPVRAERHPADWKTYGKGAGFKRNKKMVKLSADVALAFCLDDSPGTTQCGGLAEGEGIPTRWFRQYTNPPPEPLGAPR